MRIGILWKNDYPWDVRVEKIARTLHAAGHEVFILSANVQGRPRCDCRDGIGIRRLPFTRSRWLNAAISVPFYLNPFWIRHAARVARRERIELLVVRDLPLILVGLWIKRRQGIPLVLDMAEDYPAMYRESVAVGGWRSWVHWLAKNPSVMALVERFAVPRVDHTLVVVEESAQRVRARLGVSAARVSVVSNTPKLDTSAQQAPVTASDPRQPLRLVYTGFVQEARGLETVIDALALLRNRGVSVRLTIVGDGPYLPRLSQRASGVQEAVTFTGWIEHSRLSEHILEADAGIIPHPRNDHTDTTIPNKLFDYMACGKPVVVSNAAPLARIVGSERCGLVFAAGNAESLAEVLARMDADRSGLGPMGRNGAEAVRQRFNWERDGGVLVAALARFADRSG